MNTTEWCVPGQGATLADLYRALGRTVDAEPLEPAARAQLAQRTNLRFERPGPLTPHDRERIEEAIRRATELP